MEQVRVFKPEMDGVAVFQNCATLNLTTIEPHSVTALQVFNDIPFTFDHDAGVRPGCPAVANDQVVIRAAADSEWQRIDRYPCPLAGGEYNVKSSPGWRWFAIFGHIQTILERAHSAVGRACRPVR